MSWMSPRVKGAVWRGKSSDTHPGKLGPAPAREERERSNDSGKSQMPLSAASRLKESPAHMRRPKPHDQLDDTYFMHDALSTGTPKTSYDGFTPNTRSSSDSSKSAALLESRSIDRSLVGSTGTDSSQSSDEPATDQSAQSSQARASQGTASEKRANDDVANDMSLEEESSASEKRANDDVANDMSLEEESSASLIDDIQESAGEENNFEASRREALRLESLFRQQEQDRELAERLAREEDLTTSLQDLEIRNDESSILLAINLANGFVQDQGGFALHQLEEQEMILQFQNAVSMQERQLQADMEFAMRLQNESSMLESDRNLAQRLQSGSSTPDSSMAMGFDDTYQSVIPETPFPQRADEGFENPVQTPLSVFRNPFSPAFATRTQPMRSQPRSSRQSGMVGAKTQQRKGNQSNQPGQAWRGQEWEGQGWKTQEQNDSADVSFLQKMQQEEDQRFVRDRAEAQRMQNTLQAQDRVAQDKIKAEQAAIKREEFAECLICTDDFDRAEMVRPCQHWYCRGCLTGMNPYLWGLDRVLIPFMQQERSVMPTTRSRGSLSGVVNVIYPLISWRGSLEQHSYGTIKPPSWKDPRQTHYTAVIRAVQGSYRLPIFMEIMVLAEIVGVRPAATVAPEHILGSCAVKTRIPKKSRHWPVSRAGNLARVVRI